MIHLHEHFVLCYIYSGILMATPANTTRLIYLINKSSNTTIPVLQEEAQGKNVTLTVFPCISPEDSLHNNATMQNLLYTIVNELIHYCIQLPAPMLLSSGLLEVKTPVCLKSGFALLIDYNYCLVCNYRISWVGELKQQGEA